MIQPCKKCGSFFVPCDCYPIELPTPTTLKETGRWQEPSEEEWIMGCLRTQGTLHAWNTTPSERLILNRLVDKGTIRFVCNRWMLKEDK